MATFGERFKALRNEKRLTQDKLAEMFFLNKSSISRYESDKQLPEPAALQKFADFYNVSLDYLMGISDIRNPIASMKSNLDEKELCNNAKDLEKVSYDDILNYIDKHLANLPEEKKDYVVKRVNEIYWNSKNIN